MTERKTNLIKPYFNQITDKSALINPAFVKQFHTLIKL